MQFRDIQSSQITGISNLALTTFPTKFPAPYDLRSLVTRGLLFPIGLLILAMTGCASNQQVSHPHIVVDQEGFPLDDSGQRLSESGFDQQINNISRQVDEYVRREIAANRTPKLMVYIHGGLNTRNSGLKYIKDITDEAGRIKGTDLYPIFINWDSSLFSSLGDDLFAIRFGVRDPVMGIATSPLVIANRVVDSLVKAPVTLINHWDTEKMQFERWDGEERSTAEHIQNGAVAVLSLPATVVALPFLGGFGEGAWNMMNRRIDQMFAVSINPLPRFYQDEDNRPGAMRLFLEKITESVLALQSDPLTADTEISLVGHSMGTIVINHILREFPQARFDRIVYLGAAATIRDYRSTVPGYLTRHPNSQFYSYTLGIKDEAAEFNYFLPQGSLLVWIENIFQPGLSPNDKRIGFSRNKRSSIIRTDDRPLCERIHLVKFTGQSGEPRSHGAFNEDGIFQNILAMSGSRENINRDCAKCISHQSCSSLAPSLNTSVFH